MNSRTWFARSYRSLLIGVAESRMTFLCSPSRPRPPLQLDQRVQGQVAVRLVVAEVVALVDQDHVGVAVGCGVERVPAQLLHADDLGGDGGAGQLPLPHLPQRGRADDDGLLAAVVGEVLQQLLADPGLAQAHGVGDQHAVVAGQDAAGLLDGVLLELGQVHGAAAELRGVFAELLLEVLVQGLGVDLVGRVLLRAELAGVEQLDQVVLEIHRVAPTAARTSAIRSVIALAPTSLLMKRRASSGTSTPDGSSSVSRSRTCSR